VGFDAAYIKCVNRIGFLSNGEEGQYLNSEEGQNSMAESIASAIIAYRKEYSASGSDETTKRSSLKKYWIMMQRH
jgi:N-acetylmuramoyl-L-alanine amidase